MRGQLLFALASFASLSAPATAKDDYAYGPAPDWTRYREVAERAVRERLEDPKIQKRYPAIPGWSIEWPNGYIRYRWDHKGDFPGYMTCGRLRAPANSEARDRVVNFIVVLDYGAVKKVDIAPRASNDIRNQICTDWVASGKFPPATLMVATLDMDITALGLTVRSMPEGAYVVKADEAARRVGLLPGMVLVRANGIELADMGTTLAELLGSDTARLDLETVTGEHLMVTRP
ncbi:hypothetical protein NF700_12250 [Sphingomonadaceae bacterium OTU29MARTA1]|nr:hypothetical protein NF700_12250 [Sphingomonadaceae bacterium OTU29MARTA1]